MKRLTYVKCPKAWNTGRYPTKYTSRHTFQEIVERLAAYEDAEEQGLLVKLPCKVGDTVWIRYMDCCEFKEENCTDHEGSCESCPHRQPRGIEKQFTYDDIPRWGIGVFATREAAEAAMKEMEAGNGTD